MFKKLISVAVLCVFLAPSVSIAGPIMRTGEAISVDAEQSLKGDFYAFASDISISGNAENDAYLFGGTVTVNAPITEDLTVIGGVVQVHGEVGDDVRVFGGEVTIAEPIKGDLVVLGGTLNILSTASVGGDILFYGETLVVEGEVIGSIYGTADTVRINDVVHGDVSMKAWTFISLGDSASVTGSISYTSTQDLVRAQNAEIKGEVHKLNTNETSTTRIWEILALQLFVLLFASLTLYVFGQKRIQSIITNQAHSFGICGLVGLTVFLLTPIAAGILMVSIVGVFLGILLLLSYFVALLVAFLLGSILLGYLIQRFVFRISRVSATTIVMGTIALLILALVPYVGGLSIFACTMVSFGKVIIVGYEKLRS